MSNMVQVTITFSNGNKRVIDTSAEPGYNQDGTAVMVREVTEGGEEIGTYYAPTLNVLYVYVNRRPVDRKR